MQGLTQQAHLNINYKHSNEWSVLLKYYFHRGTDEDKQNGICYDENQTLPMDDITYSFYSKHQ